MTKWLLAIWIAVTLGLLLVYANRARIERALLVPNLFTGKRQVQNFGRMEALFPSAVVKASAKPQRSWCCRTARSARSATG
jgi:hypothetical protein